MSDKIAKILINDDGTAEIDMVGWEGQGCSADIQGLIDALGSDKTVTKKEEYYRDEPNTVDQRW